MRQMRDCQSCGHTAMLVKEDQIGQGGSISATDEVGQNECPAIETDGCGK